MAKKPKVLKVSEGLDLHKNEPTLSGRKGLTVGSLTDALSIFPRDAEVIFEQLQRWRPARA